MPPHRRLRLIRGGVESSAREVLLRAGSLVSPPSTVPASSRAVREVRGGEEDFFDGLEEDLLASRGNVVEPHSMPFTGTTVPAVTGELRNHSQHQVSVMDMTANGNARGTGSPH